MKLENKILAGPECVACITGLICRPRAAPFLRLFIDPGFAGFAWLPATPGSVPDDGWPPKPLGSIILANLTPDSSVKSSLLLHWNLRRATLSKSLDVRTILRVQL